MTSWRALMIQVKTQLAKGECVERTDECNEVFEILEFDQVREKSR